MHFSMLNECRNLLTIFLRWFETKIIQKKKSTFGFGWKRKRVGEGNSEMEVGFSYIWILPKMSVKRCWDQKIVICRWKYKCHFRVIESNFEILKSNFKQLTCVPRLKEKFVGKQNHLFFFFL